MEAKLLKQGNLPRLLDALTRDYVVIAPKDELSYGEIYSASEFYAGDDKPRKSLKEFFFPPREVLLEYTVSKGTATMTPATAPTGQRVAFCRPCDAAALPILDKVFTWDYLDGSYLQRRQNTIVITMACDEPCETCFCVSLGGSPAGTDMFCALCLGSLASFRYLGTAKRLLASPTRLRGGAISSVASSESAK